MKNRFDQKSEQELANFRARVMGLGENSGRKSYYPELRRRLSELERFRSLIDHSNDFVIVAEAKSHKIEDVNQTLCRSLGFSKQDILQMALSDLIDGYSETSLAEQSQLTTCLIAKNGRQTPVEIRFSLVHMAHAKYLLIIARDITEQQKIHEELLASRERAEAANTAKSEFLANMSHEIRTPLNSLLGFSDVLSETELDEEQRGYIRAILRSGASLLNLINDVLELSKIEAGKIHLESLVFRPRELIEENFYIMTKGAQNKGLSAVLDVDGKIPETLRGDPHRLRQIITNLLSNAIKFTESGGVTLRVSVASVTAGQCTLLFEVSDTGVGIAPDHVESLFDRFTQVDSSLTRRYGGSGLGLNIVKQLVDLIGGEIWVESALGRGSSFYLKLSYELLDSGEGPDEDMKDFSGQQKKLTLDVSKTGEL